MDGWRYLAMTRPRYVTHHSQVPGILREMYRGVATTIPMEERIRQWQLRVKKAQDIHPYLGSEV